MSKYSSKEQEAIQKTMREFYEGSLRSGPSGKKVTDRQQALAIGISKAKHGIQKLSNKEDGKI